jgi:peptide/nickel transport system substrate-binding protein
MRSVRFRLSRRSLLLSTLALGGALAGGAAATGSVLAADGGTATAALTAEPQSLDPLFDTNLPALNIYYNVFDQLTGLDEKGKTAPRLATDWAFSPDLKTWTFNLRKDAKFQDGSPVTAADVVFTYDAAKNDPKSKLGGYLTTMTSVKAQGDYTVVFELNTPFAPWDRQVTLVSIVPMKAYKEMGPAAFAKKPVGSGPYSVVSWVASEKITLKRFDGYWGAKGNFESVVFEPVPDDTTRANSVQSGDIDVAALGPASVAAVKASGKVNVVEQTSNRIIYVGFNSKVKWLSDPNIRKAIDLAIDRNAIGQKLLNGSIIPSSQLVSPMSFGYDPAIPPSPYDPEKAKTLIASAKYDGSPIILTYPTSFLPQIDQMAQVIGYYLSEVGLNVKLDAEEYNTALNKWFGGSFEGAYIFAFAPSLLDADLPFNMLLRTGGQGYFSDPAIDKLLDAEVGQPDTKRRAEDLSKISQAVNAGTYYAPLFSDNYIYGVKKGLKWTPLPNGMMVFN